MLVNRQSVLINNMSRESTEKFLSEKISTLKNCLATIDKEISALMENYNLLSDQISESFAALKISIMEREGQLRKQLSTVSNSAQKELIMEQLKTGGNLGKSR